MRTAARTIGILLLVGVSAGATSAAQPPGWTTYGGDPSRTGSAVEPLAPASVKPNFVLPINGRVLSQVLAARDVPAPGRTTLYVTTTAGRIYAVSETGYVRWRVDLGQLANPCPQLDGYGVVGTPVIDPEAGALYAADALGRLHALDLRTGAERSGWPVTLFSDPDRELVWGAVALADGSVYVGTGSYCDAGPFEGRIVRVNTATRETSTWLAVPAAQGGGGGIWGWGGVAYSPRLDRLFVVTGNAFPGGSNVGDAFTESAGYGEAIVTLSPSLEPVGASHPSSINAPDDLDFVGSPVLFDRPGCGELAVAVNKNAQLFGWRADDVASGPLWTVDLEKFDPADPVLSQPAYDAKQSAVYAVTGSSLIRVDIGADCGATVAWTTPLGTDSLNGSPTIAAGTVWLALSGTPGLAGFDANTGRKVVSLPLPGLTITEPTVIDGRLYLGTFTGQLVGFTSTSARVPMTAPFVPGVPGHVSRLDARNRWESRESGVYSTDDGGRHWRRISPMPASSVIRTSVNVGLIRVATVAAGCTCTRTFWTKDGGKHWTQTRAVAGGLTGRGPFLYWLTGSNTQLQQVSPWPPVGAIHSRTVLSLDRGRIVSRALVPGGIAVLVRDPSTGAGSVRVVRGSDSETIALPAAPGEIVSESLNSTNMTLTVNATVFSDGRTRTARWSSAGDEDAWQVGEGHLGIAR